MTDRLSTLLIITGAALLLAGILLRLGLLSWFGSLPGDLRIGGESARLYVPITSMLLISAVLSIAAMLIGKLLGGD